MGIVNVTPDSFSDGGRFLDVDAAAAHARRLIAEGADILDIGGESTRPGAEPVAEAEEIARVVPVIAAIRRESQVPISIDTMKPAVARAAVAAGATMWNDVTALRHAPDSLATAAELGCEVVLMHMQGEPRTMQAAPRYDDVVAEVAAFLAARAEAAMAAGVARERIWLDPGIGFGKTFRRTASLCCATSTGSSPSAFRCCWASAARASSPASPATSRPRTAPRRLARRRAGRGAAPARR